MLNSSNSPVKQNYFLQSGFIFVPAKSTDISTVLGSCVAVCLYDKKRQTGGMNHFQLPFIDEKLRATARYGNVATFALIHMMLNDGSKIKHLEAQIFGGAYNPKISPENIGRDNIKIARNILAKKKYESFRKMWGVKGAEKLSLIPAAVKLPYSKSAHCAKAIGIPISPIDNLVCLAHFLHILILGRQILSFSLNSR